MMSGKSHYYELPKIKEWNEKDKVSIKLRIGNEKLAACNCIYIVYRSNSKDECDEEAEKDGLCSLKRAAIFFDIPEELANETATIIITVSDGIGQSTYYLGISANPYIEP